MTQELSPKAAAGLLKKAFQDKGAKLTHTEALDLIARMKGFEAWSHLQKASKRSTASAVKVKTEDLVDVLRSHYGQWGQCDLLPRDDWTYQVENGYTGQGYWEWVVSELEVQDLYQGPFSGFTRPKPVSVTRPDGSTGLWGIETDLTDRWGELNDHNTEQKPGLAILRVEPGLLARLQVLMREEITFVTRRNGEFGLLFEVEFASKESEANTGSSELDQFKPHDQVVKALLDGMKELQAEFNVDFAVPPKELIAYERPAAWAYVPLKDLSDSLASRLASAMLNL